MTAAVHIRNKQLVYDYLHAGIDDNLDRLNDVLHPGVVWHGFQPIPELRGASTVIERFWKPIQAALAEPTLQIDILLADHRRGADWVSATGVIGQLQTTPFVAATSNLTLTDVRFGAHYRIGDGKIVEAFMLIDLLELLYAAQIATPLAAALGEEGVRVAPATGDGLQLGAHDAQQGAISYDLVWGMLFDGLNRYDGQQQSMRLEDYWHPQMKWYGPHGIGASYDIEQFQQYHQIPFLTAFPKRQATPHNVFIGDGNYVSACGYPGVIGKHDGPYLGIAPTGNEISMNLMDFWRAEAGLLVENWVLIDMVDVFMQMGVDLLAGARTRE